MPCHSPAKEPAQPDWPLVYPPCQEEGWHSLRFLIIVARYTTALSGLRCDSFQTNKAECGCLTFSLLDVDCFPSGGIRSPSSCIGQDINLHKLASCRHSQSNDPLSFHLPLLPCLNEKTFILANAALVLPRHHAHLRNLTHFTPVDEHLDTPQNPGISK